MWTLAAIKRFIRHGDDHQRVVAQRVREHDEDRRRRRGAEGSDHEMADISGLDLDLSPLASGLSSAADEESGGVPPVQGYQYMGSGLHTWASGGSSAAGAVAPVDTRFTGSTEGGEGTSAHATPHATSYATPDPTPAPAIHHSVTPETGVSHSSASVHTTVDSGSTSSATSAGGYDAGSTAGSDAGSSGSTD